MTASGVARRAGASPRRWLAVAMVLVAAAMAVTAPAAAAEPIVVRLDQAMIMKMPERAATVVVGNPLIADLSIEPGNIAVVTGKGYGATNFIVMDRSGAVLLEKSVEVTEPAGNVIFVYRGNSRESYSCTPGCDRRINLGDDKEYFDKTLSETTTRNTQAAGAAASSGH